VENELVPPDPMHCIIVRAPPVKEYALAFLTAAARSGDEGTIRLAAHLTGAEPCEGCGFIWNHCRCKPKTAMAQIKEKIL